MRANVVMDAVHIPSGRVVYLKRGPTRHPEYSILLSLTNLPPDPRNHCVPILDSFQEKDNPDVTFMVMPFLQRIDNPPFQTAGDVIDFVGQMLEVKLGLVLVFDSVANSLTHGRVSHSFILIT